MRIATVTIEGVSPYQQGKYIDLSQFPLKTKPKKETQDEREQRIWRERGYYDEKGIAYIPNSALLKAMIAGAKHGEIKLKDKGNTGLASRLGRGVMQDGVLSLGVKKADVEGTGVLVPLKGTPGKGPHGIRYFPTFWPWGGTVSFFVYEDEITEEKFEAALTLAGKFIGLGVWRPEHDGQNGRFKVVKVEWTT